MANHTVGAAEDQRAAVVADPRTGAAEVAAACLAAESPPVRTPYSCPASASAGAAVYCGAVAVAVVGDGCVGAAAVAVAVPDVVVLQKLQPNLSDSAAVAGVGGVGAV